MKAHISYFEAQTKVNICEKIKWTQDRFQFKQLSGIGEKINVSVDTKV